MNNLQSARTKNIISAQCSVCALFFGIFLCFPGAVLTGMGNTNRSEFFESSHRPMRIIGPILLVIGLTLILCATAMCVYLRTVMQSTSRQNASSMQGGQSSGPVIMGAAPGDLSGVPLGPVHRQSVPLGPANQHIGNYHYNSKDDNLYDPSAPPPSYESVTSSVPSITSPDTMVAGPMRTTNVGSGFNYSTDYGGFSTANSGGGFSSGDIGGGGGGFSSDTAGGFS